MTSFNIHNPYNGSFTLRDLGGLFLDFTILLVIIYVILVIGRFIYLAAQNGYCGRRVESAMQPRYIKSTVLGNVMPDAKELESVEIE